MGKELDKDLEVTEAKATGEDSVAADPVTPTGGKDHKRKADKKVAGEKADDIEDDVKTPQGPNNVGLKEAIDALFGETDLTEDFKAKTLTIFEAAVFEKVEEEKAALEEQYKVDLDEAVEAAREEITEEMTEKLDAYLESVVENWLSENEVALETGYKVQVAESLFNGLKSLMSEHNIELDELEVDAIATMEEQVATTEAKYNDLFETLIRERAKTEDLEKELVLVKLSEGLADTDVARLRTLSEGIDYDDVEQFETKLNVIKESYFTESVKKADDQSELLEEVLTEETTPAATMDPAIAAYVNSLNKFRKN